MLLALQFEWATPYSTTVRSQLSLAIWANAWPVNYSQWYSASAAPALKFFGVNAHYFQGLPYSSNLTAQAADCSNIAVQFVRQDCYANDQSAVAHTMIPQFGSIIVQPIFNQYGTFSTSETTTYNNFHQFGSAYAVAIAGKVQIIEMMNEPENEFFPGGVIGSNGQNVTDYSTMDIRYWNSFRGMVRGFYDGFRGVDTAMQTLIASPAVTWLHYGILRGLWDGEAPDGTTGHNVCRWDIVNQHWYLDFGDITDIDFGGGNIVNVLSDLNGYWPDLPIQLSEIGVQDSQTEATYDSYILSAVSQYCALKSTYNICGIAWYELYDFEAGGGGELMGLYSAIAAPHAARASTMLSAIDANS